MADRPIGERVELLERAFAAIYDALRDQRWGLEAWGEVPDDPADNPLEAEWLREYRESLP